MHILSTRGVRLVPALMRPGVHSVRESMIGQRIKQARVAAAMTQDEVVAALDAAGHPLTKAGLSKYERGGSVPKPTTLRALGKVLRVPAEFFLEEARATVGVEWLPPRGARLTIAAEERIKTLATAQVETVVTLRRTLEPKRVWPGFPRVKVPRGSIEAAETAAEHAARQLRKAWHVGDAPIESVVETIEDAGGIVVETDGPADGGDDAADTAFDGMAGWVDGSTPIIVVGAAVPDDARRVRLACELGRLALDAIKSDAPTMARVVQRFATAFLVPADAARRELGERRRHLDLRELAILKVKYGLSMQAWIYRATDLGIIDPAHGRSLLAELGARGWRKAEPVAFDAHERRVRERTVRERPLRLRQLTVRAHAEGLLTEAQAERICPGATRERIYWGATARRATPRRMDARALLKLPPPEREQLLARAARLVKGDYEKGGALAGFEADDE
jgi:Zn-dependent peptidase ImmA (M78 family)/transcriptional regulator with XRE-family HTH domain